MKPSVHIELTGRGFLTGLGMLVAALMLLGLVWLVAGVGYALAGGILLVLLVRGFFALVTPGR